jgi:hypothetical protein
VLARALAIDPASRYAEARQLDEALRSAMKRVDDASNLRRQLGEMVRRAKPAMRTEDAEAGNTPSSAVVPSIAHAKRTPGRAGPRTQVLDPSTERSHSRWKGPAAVGIVLAAGVLAAALGARWLTTRQSAELAELATSSATLPPSITQRTVDAAAARAPDTTVSAADAGARRANQRTTRGTRPQRAEAGHPRANAGHPRARGSTGSESANGVRARLDEVDRVLAGKGILPADDPALFARRRALTQPGASAAEVQTLLGRARAIVVNRAFVHAKLTRLNRKMAAARVDARLQQQLQQRAQQALSHAVTGRYTEANRDLNAIAAVIER